MYRYVTIIISFFISVSIVSAQGLTDKEQLGKNIFFDKISNPDWMSCATCHAPEVGFTGPIPGTNLTTAVYRGAIPTRHGNRKPPSAAYATLSPVFHYDEDEGLFVGGNFWDGRATGEHLGNPAADQALGPFLNPVEQNNADEAAVLQQIAESKYADLWEDVWGEPVSYTINVDLNYDRVGLAIAAYENSSEVNQFSSKYDYYLAGEAELTEQEAWGLSLFNDEEKGKCALCHISAPDENGNPPIFTDFTFDNLGVPKNPDNPVYEEDPNFIDPGLGGFLLTTQWADMAADNMGKHKVPTLRNVAKAPSVNFPKAYMHNGVFKSLEEVVHFYNTRDIEDWPAPEVSDNVNKEELGNLGLSADEEEAIVAFMKTLSDGYNPQKDKIKSTSLVTFSVTGANPFNPVTYFSYSIPEAANIQIRVFNSIGQQVATLVNTNQSAGAYRVKFDGTNLSSGIYFVTLSTNSFTQTRKISLLK